MATKTDYLKQTVAQCSSLLATADTVVGMLAADPGNIDEHAELLRGLILQARTTLIDTVKYFGPLNVYSDGRQVTSAIDLGGGCVYRHRWHPDWEHDDNCRRVVGSAGGRVVLVTGDQQLDLVQGTAG